MCCSFHFSVFGAVKHRLTLADNREQQRTPTTACRRHLNVNIESKIQQRRSKKKTVNNQIKSGYLFCLYAIVRWRKGRKERNNVDVSVLLVAAVIVVFIVVVVVVGVAYFPSSSSTFAQLRLLLSLLLLLKMRFYLFGLFVDNTKRRRRSKTVWLFSFIE